MGQAKLSKKIKTVNDLLISDTNAHLIGLLQRDNPQSAILLYPDHEGNTQIYTGCLDASLIIAMLEIAKAKVINEMLEGPLTDTPNI